jgi:hypothetical protein
MEVHGLDLTCFCEHVNEPLGSRKCGEFLNLECNYYTFKGGAA